MEETNNKDGIQMPHKILLLMVQTVLLVLQFFKPKNSLANCKVTMFSQREEMPLWDGVIIHNNAKDKKNKYRPI